MSVIDRTATAPISWGICEVPGWGLQLPAERVLSEMNELGFGATELGSIGYLPTDPLELKRTLKAHALSLSGGFVPLALHDPAMSDESMAAAEGAAELLAAAGARHFVTCVVSDPNDWHRPALRGDAWGHLFKMIEELDRLCGRHGLVQALHPHVNSLVETAAEIQRLVDETGVGFTLDTGHFEIGGSDSLRFIEGHSDRVTLVHLKDLRCDIAARLNEGEVTLMEAVQSGLFPPLGQGDLPIAEIVGALELSGYSGWYVIEQDVALTDGTPRPGDGPIRGVEASVEYLRSLDADAQAGNGAGDSPAC